MIVIIILITTTYSSSSLSCALSDLYPHSTSTNQVLFAAQAKYSSFICFGGEHMECWNLDKRFLPYDYSERYCLFSNVVWRHGGEEGAVMDFYQDENNAPLWDFDHGRTRFDFNATEYSAHYGVHIRLVNGPVPTTTTGGGQVDTLVLAHEQQEGGAGGLSVWAAFQAMASTGMLSLQAHVAVKQQHQGLPLSRYWHAIARTVTTWSQVPVDSRVRHAVLVPVNGRQLLPHEELARVFRARALHLAGLPDVLARSSSSSGAGDTALRVGLQLPSGVINPQPVLHQLKAKYGGSVELVNPAAALSLREEIAQMQALDMYALVFPGNDALSAAFLRPGAIALLGHTCDPPNGTSTTTTRECSLYAARWTMFPQFAKQHVRVAAAGEDGMRIVDTP